MLVDQGSRLLTISPTDHSFEASIRDNEALTASITANADSVAEGDETVFTVTLMGGVSTRAVRVEFETSGTATVVDDYGTLTGSLTFPSGNTTGIAASLEIPAGQSSGTITYPVLSDIEEEGPEALIVELLGASSGERTVRVSDTGSMATTDILDQGSLTASITGSPIVEEGAAATFTVTMSKTLDQNVSVDWATTAGGGTAEADVDYTAASGTAVIPVGSTSTTFMVSTSEDTLVEEDETFRVILEEASIPGSNPRELIPLGVTVALGIIEDNDIAPTTFSFTVSPSEVAEDAGATDLTVTVTLDGTTQFTVDTPVSVEMIDCPNVDENASLGVDYTATMSNVTIPAGQSSVTATITLTPVDDNFAEGNERAQLSVKSSVLADPAGKIVTIRDNDEAPSEIKLTVTPDSVDELMAATRLTITAALVGEASLPTETVISLSLEDGTAVVGDDFEPATASLTIPAGEMDATAFLNLGVLDDNVAESEETL